MQATTVSENTHFIHSNHASFRVWFNQARWQIDIRRSGRPWMYFAHAASLAQAFAQIAITL